MAERRRRHVPEEAREQGRVIREAMEGARWSISRLSRVTGINPGTIFRIEHGRGGREEQLRNIALTLAEPAGMDAIQLQYLLGLPSHGKLEQPPQEEALWAAYDRGELRTAEMGWYSQARDAAIRGDMKEWARTYAHAGLAALEQAKFEVAQGRFKAVINSRPEIVGAEWVFTAQVWLGWLYYEQQRLEEARVELDAAEAKGRRLIASGSDSRDDPSLQFTVQTVHHFLGRLMSDLAMLEGRKMLRRSALDNLEVSYRLNKRFDRPFDMGWSLLRKAPLLFSSADAQEKRLAESTMDESLELMGNHEKARGYAELYRALQPEQDPRAASILLERALKDFQAPVYHPRGLSDGLREMGSLLEDRDQVESAFEYVLTATALHPYRQNLGALERILNRLYVKLGAGKFATYCQDSITELRMMRREPFSTLRPYVAAFGPDEEMEQLERALERVQELIARVRGDIKRAA